MAKKTNSNGKTSQDLTYDGKGYGSDTLNLNDYQGVNSIVVQKTFGRPEDYIELHLYNTSDELIDSNLNFKDYEFPPAATGTVVTNQKASELLFNPSKILSDLGLTSGKFKLKFKYVECDLLNEFNLKIKNHKGTILNISNIFAYEPTAAMVPTKQRVFRENKLIKL